MAVDLNCDLGEGAGSDADLLPFVTSASIAAGLHAGGPVEALAALRLAVRHGVSVGVHPGYPDRVHFGRRDLDRSDDDVWADTLYQVGALMALAQEAGTQVRYLKPHGALYHRAGRDADVADALIAVAERYALAVVGLPASQLQARSAGRCRFVPEGFADRRYLPDGTLVPRARPDAVLHDPAEAVAQMQALLAAGFVETICVHGDTPAALAFVRALRTALAASGIPVRAFA